VDKVSLERKTAITTSPGLSVTRLVLIRVRILAEWLVKRTLDFGHRRKALKSTRLLKNSQADNSCIVIANGPSSEKLDWKEVGRRQQLGLQVCAINYFPLAPHFKTLVPNYLVLSDPIMKPGSSKDSRNGPLWNAIQEASEMKLVFPISWYQLIESDSSLLSRSYFFDDSGLEGWTRNISPLRARGYLALTAYKALAFAVHLGFIEIDIIGIDNTMYQTMEVNFNNEIVQAPNHFFTGGGITVGLSPMYPNGVADYFQDVSLCFYSLKSCFSNRNIYNLDRTSLVDCFVKRDVSPLLIENMDLGRQ